MGDSKGKFQLCRFGNSFYHGRFANAISIKLLFNAGSAILPTINGVEDDSFLSHPQTVRTLENFRYANPYLIDSFFSELRKSIRALGVSILAVTLIIFFLSPRLLQAGPGTFERKAVFFFDSGTVPCSCEAGPLRCPVRHDAMDYDGPVAGHGETFRCERRATCLFYCFYMSAFLRGDIFLLFTYSADGDRISSRV